ncbi:DUF2460 domain-containing protein [Methylosinus sp. H3A]|nr:DUF2460 domain-containing protein [Methylosinus sp. H3A]
MTSFHEVLFPCDIALGSCGGPERRTDIATMRSGFEERNSIWAALDLISDGTDTTPKRARDSAVGPAFSVGGRGAASCERTARPARPRTESSALGSRAEAASP